MNTCDKKRVCHINFDKDKQIEDEVGFEINSLLTIVNGNSYTISGKKSGHNSGKKILFDIKREDAIVRVNNLNITDVDIVCRMSKGASVIFYDCLIINAKSFCQGHTCKDVTLVNSIVLKTPKIISGGTYDKFLANNTNFLDVKKLISAKFVKDVSINNAEIRLTSQSKGLFSSKQNIDRYAIIKSTIVGGLADNVALFSPSSHNSSHGIFDGNNVLLRRRKQGSESNSWWYLSREEPALSLIFKAEAISQPIARILNFNGNVIESDSRTFFDISGNGSDLGLDKFIITNNSLTTNESKVVLSITNFSPPDMKLPQLPKSCCIFSNNIVIGNNMQATGGSAVAVVNSEGVIISKNTLSNFKAAAIEIDVSSTSHTSSQVFLGSNDIQNSSSGIRNQSKEVAGLPNSLYANSVSVSGATLSLPKLVPS